MALKNIFGPMLLLCLAAISYGASGQVAISGKKTPNSIVLRLENLEGHSHSVIAGPRIFQGDAGFELSVLSKKGERLKQCVRGTPSSKIMAEKILEHGNSTYLEMSISSISRMFCLEEGVYTLEAEYYEKGKMKVAAGSTRVNFRVNSDN